VSCKLGFVSFNRFCSASIFACAAPASSDFLNSRKIHRKMPTSVSLPPEIVEELKKVATKKGIPYQVLMRSFIIEGLQRLKEVT
jgi:hypothetical protein